MPLRKTQRNSSLEQVQDRLLRYIKKSIGGSLSSVLTDTSEATYAFSWTSGAYVELGFTDNYIVNNSGYDLALFELGIPDSFKLTIGSTTNQYTTFWTGYSAGGWDLNVALIDLNDFGIASGGKVNNIKIGMDIVGGYGTVPSLSLAGALNSTAVPIPGAIWLLGPGLFALEGLRRKFKR